MARFNSSKGLAAGLRAGRKRRAEEAALEMERQRRASLSAWEREQEDLMDEIRWQLAELKRDQDAVAERLRRYLKEQR